MIAAVNLRRAFFFSNAARGLRAAAKMIQDGDYDKLLADRYAGYKMSSLGARIREDEEALSLEELALHAKATDEPPMRSGQHEKFESIFNAYAMGH